MQEQDLDLDQDEQELTEFDKMLVKAYDKCFGTQDSRSPEEKIDRWQGRFDSEADFAESFFLEGGQPEAVEQCLDLGIRIDWQGTWDSTLRFDFASVFIDGLYVIFSRQ